MNLEEIAKGSKAIRITNRAEYDEARNILLQLETEAKRILNYFNRAKKSKDKNTLFYLDETMTSKYLKTLATTLEKFEDITEEYHSTSAWTSQENSLNNTIHSNAQTIVTYEIGDESEFMEPSSSLFMYSAYLKHKKNLKILDIEELKRVKRHPINPKSFQLEISEEKYNKINNNLDKLNCEIIPKLIGAPFLAVGIAAKYVASKIDKFFDQYKHNESGTYEEFIMEKEKTSVTNNQI